MRRWQPLGLSLGTPKVAAPSLSSTISQTCLLFDLSPPACHRTVAPVPCFASLTSRAAILLQPSAQRSQQTYASCCPRPRNNWSGKRSRPRTKTSSPHCYTLLENGAVAIASRVVSVDCIEIHGAVGEQECARWVSGKTCILTETSVMSSFF